MVISNEPGYYAEGKFGIRIENVDVVKRAETRENFGNKGYLELERVTMVSTQAQPATSSPLHLFTFPTLHLSTFSLHSTTTHNCHYYETWGLS